MGVTPVGYLSSLICMANVFMPYLLVLKQKVPEMGRRSATGAAAWIREEQILQ